MLTCALPDFDSEDLVSFQNPAKFWTLFTICVIAALLLLCSLVYQLSSLYYQAPQHIIACYPLEFKVLHKKGRRRIMHIQIHADGW